MTLAVALPPLAVQQLNMRRTQPSESRELSAWIKERHYTLRTPPGYVLALEFTCGGGARRGNAFGQVWGAEGGQGDDLGTDAHVLCGRDAALYREPRALDDAAPRADLAAQRALTGGL